MADASPTVEELETPRDVFGIDADDVLAELLVTTGVVTRHKQKEKIIKIGATPAQKVKFDQTKIEPHYQTHPKEKQAILGLNSRFAGGLLALGPAGGGKTTLMRVIAIKTGRQIVVHQCARGQNVRDLLGDFVLEVQQADTTYRVEMAGSDPSEIRGILEKIKVVSKGQVIAKMVWIDGPLAESIRMSSKGVNTMLVLEEANMLDASTLAIFNNLTDGSGYPLRLGTGERIQVDTDKWKVALCINEGYTGTRELNTALRNRLKSLFIDYLPPKQESKGLQIQTGAPAEWCDRLVDFANLVRAARRKGKLQYDLSPRSLCRMIEERGEGFSWEDAFESCVLDEIGDPNIKGPFRKTVYEIAQSAGIKNW